MVSDTSQNRIGEDERLYINVARGFAVLLMLWGHCIQYCCAGSFSFLENSVFKIIYSFHMPLFMLISGYLFYYSFRKRNLKELIVHRTQALLHPLIICGILAFFLIDCVFVVIPEKNFKYLWDGAWLNHMRDYWFLWSVLSSSIVVGIVFKTAKNIWLQLVLSIFGIFAVAIFPEMIMNVYMYPYFVLGFLFAEFKDTDWANKLCKLKYAFIAIFPIMMPFFTRDHYIYTTGLAGTEGIINHMPENLFRWAIGLAGSICVLTILELVIKFVSNKNGRKDVLQFVGQLGEKSLQIYILSRIFVSKYLPHVVGKIVANLGHNILADNMIVYEISTFVLAILFSIFLMYLVKTLEKTKISKVLFGK